MDPWLTNTNTQNPNLMFYDIKNSFNGLKASVIQRFHVELYDASNVSIF